MNRIFLSPPHMGGEESNYVEQAFKSNYIAPLGPMVDAFERELAEYTGLSHCLALSSGTAAMHLALRLLDTGPGDEVFTSDLTFIGSVTPAVYQGATPVFIDCEKGSWNMDPDLLEAEMKRAVERGKPPKAVIPTDLYGQCADYDRIKTICDAHGVPLVVDAAEAMGAFYKGRHAGCGADFAVFSFNGNKIITTSGGGMLASDDEAAIRTARNLSQQARDPMPHYEHSTCGYNYRMSNISAAIGRGQLRRLDDRVARRREIYDFYHDALGGLPGVEFMPEADWGRCNRWLTVILIAPEDFGVDRETARVFLESENIESRPVWKPMHLQPVFDCEEGPDKDASTVLRDALLGKRVRARRVGGETSEELFERGLCLPSGTAMSDADLERVADAVRRSRRRS